MRDLVSEILRQELAWTGEYLLLPSEPAEAVEVPTDEVVPAPEPFVPAPEVATSPGVSATREPSVEASAPDDCPGPMPQINPADYPDAATALEALRTAMGDCRRCPLGGTRNHLVFGEGAPQAKVMFVGEAPGAREDASGQPFVGEAGELLARIIENGMGLKRQDVYITNILKCRPSGNRDPQTGEVACCGKFLEQQIAIIRPRVIVALGTYATQYLCNSEEPISELRGTFVDRGGILVMPTFHPSYLLRNPAKKREVWEDIKKVLGHLGMSRSA